MDFLFHFIDLSYSSTILLIIIRNLHYILIQSYSPIQTFLSVLINLQMNLKSQIFLYIGVSI